jgi:type II secretory pathway pseudopilin PulG
VKLRAQPRGGEAGAPASPRDRHAFTLIEIAICLGIIAFALVAIIGILPAGLQVQRDNREDTIINQEGSYLLEAIRNGAEGIEDLSNRVNLIVVSNVTKETELDRYYQPDDKLTAKQIAGFLGRPSELGDDVLEVRALIYAGAGSAASLVSQWDTLDQRIDFKYQVTIRNFAYTNSNPVFSPKVQNALADYLRDVRLDIRWPVIERGNVVSVGIGRQNFRGQLSGRMVFDDPNPKNYGPRFWFLRQ